MEGLFSHISFFIGLISAAAALALIEIQIEGANGWATNLPTWRIAADGPWRWLLRMFPGRPLTGYHLWMLVFMAIVSHLPFAFGLPWTPAGEMRAVAFFLLFWVAEDFLWFVLNPHFGIRRFRPEHIPWHRRAWWWIAPRDYWIATAIGVALYAASRRSDEVVILALRGAAHGGG